VLGQFPAVLGQFPAVLGRFLAVLGRFLAVLMLSAGSLRSVQSEAEDQAGATRRDPQRLGEETV
jgi:hypothetical protein